MKKQINICILTNRLEGPGFAISFMKLLEPIAERLIIITGNFPKKDVFSSKIELINVSSDDRVQSIFLRIPKFFLFQLKMSYHLIRNISRMSVVVFFLDGGELLLPAFLAKLFFKKIVRIVTHSASQIASQVQKNTKEKKYYQISLAVLEYLNYLIANKLIVYSPSMIYNLNLSKYKDKILVASRHYLDPGAFDIITPLNERKKQIGFLGRLSEEKGAINFVQAIPLILNKCDDFSFVIIGPGPLKTEIEAFINKQNLQNKVQLLGLVPHDEMAKYLNELKLVIIPSYTEGLSNVMLEAMACGTPVLANAVGGIPDIIIDQKTGFIMENNTPECIAQNAVRCLSLPQLNEIAIAGRDLIHNEFTFDNALAKYSEIFLNQI